MTNLEGFIKDRDEALRSLDYDKIAAYFKKYNGWTWPNTTVAWAGVHKARITLNTFTVKEKKLSRDWLIDHGYKAKGLD